MTKGGIHVCCQPPLPRRLLLFCKRDFLDFPFPPPRLQGLGIWIVFETMRQPHTTNTPTIGCTPPKSSSAIIPPSTPSRPPSTMPRDVAMAMPNTKLNDVGIGNPSKYLLLPVASFGTAATVTLNRARRVSPHRTKKERNSVSRGVRRPRANAAVAGATPKEI